MTAPHDLDPGHTMIMEAVVKLVQSVGCSLQSWKASGGAEGTWEGSQFHAKADQWAHQLIGEGLSNLKTELPVVSEEDLLPGGHRGLRAEPQRGPRDRHAQLRVRDLG